MWVVRDIWCVITLPEGDAAIATMGRAQRLPFNFTRCCFFRKREEKQALAVGGPVWAATLTNGPLGNDVLWDGSATFSQFWSPERRIPQDQLM